MIAQIHLVRATKLVFSLQVTRDQHCEQKRSNTSRVRLIQITTFQEGFEDENEWFELWVLLLQEFYEFYGVYAIGPIKRYIHLYICLFVL